MSQILLFIPPSFALASLVVHTLAFIAPVGLLRNFGLASITPTTTDAPRVWMGVLGSCARRDYFARTNCTRATLSPKYDLSLISADDAIAFKAATPLVAHAALICTSLVIMILFFISLAWRASLWSKEKKARPLSWKRLADCAIIGTGIASFLGGIIYAILSVGFSNAIKTFNEKQVQKTQARNQIPTLIASPGRSLTLVWIGYVLLCTSLIALLLESFLSAKAASKETAKEDAAKEPAKTEPPA